MEEIDCIEFIHSKYRFGLRLLEVLPFLSMTGLSVALFVILWLVGKLNRTVSFLFFATALRAVHGILGEYVIADQRAPEFFVQEHGSIILKYISAISVAIYLYCRCTPLIPKIAPGNFRKQRIIRGLYIAQALSCQAFIAWYELSGRVSRAVTVVLIWVVGLSDMCSCGIILWSLVKSYPRAPGAHGASLGRIMQHVVYASEFRLVTAVVVGCLFGLIFTIPLGPRWAGASVDNVTKNLVDAAYLVMLLVDSALMLLVASLESNVHVWHNGAFHSSTSKTGNLSSRTLIHSFELRASSESNRTSS